MRRAHHPRARPRSRPCARGVARGRPGASPRMDGSPRPEGPRRARPPIRLLSGAGRGASSPRTHRVASLGGPPPHGDRRRERRRWTRPRGGSSTYPSEGDCALEGRGTRRASRRARRRARLPVTRGRPTRVHAVADMPPPLCQKHARVGVSPEVSAEARGGKYRLRVPSWRVVAWRWPRVASLAARRAARCRVPRATPEKKTGTEILSVKFSGPVSSVLSITFGPVDPAGLSFIPLVYPALSTPKCERASHPLLL